MDWLNAHAWQSWLALALVLGVTELFSLDLVLLMLAGGAVVGVVLAVLGLPGVLQVLGAAAAAVAMLTFVRPSVVRRLHAGPDLKHGFTGLVGQNGFAVQEISAQGGQIKIAGEIWTARPYDERDVIPPGARVEVYRIQGATAYVASLPELES